MSKKPRSLRVEAVVLRHFDWGEADRLLGIYSKEQGKIRAVVKGARRLRSRKAGHLEPFTRVVLMLAQGRDLWIVTQAESINSYPAIRADLLRTSYASYIVELYDRFSFEEGENYAMYKLLTATLGRIEKEDDLFTVVRYCEIKLLNHLGFRPELFHCVQCQKEIKPQDQYFSALLGGVLCPTCGEMVTTARRISVSALKYIRHVQRSSYQEAMRAGSYFSKQVQQEVESILQHYLTYLLERGLNTVPFLRQVRESNPGNNGES